MTVKRILFNINVFPLDYLTVCRNNKQNHKFFFDISTFYYSITSFINSASGIKIHAKQIYSRLLYKILRVYVYVGYSS